jgi:LmbE family N-acetylglucosaminyl deacetylase
MIVFIPGEFDAQKALARTTHLGIGAHPDDLEIMAIHGIGLCHKKRDKWFSGVIVTDGGKSARAGAFKGFSDKQMVDARLDEQQRAAELGDYSVLACLGWKSHEVKGRQNQKLVQDLAKLVLHAQPDVIYTHNIFDAHETHTSVALHVIAAIRSLSPDARPKALYGGEVWRSLDWVPRDHRIDLDISAYQDLMRELVACFPSQLASKRYDLATAGRKLANATYAEPRVSDAATAVDLMLDMTPLVRDPSLDVRAYAVTVLSDFSKTCARSIKWK